MHSILFVCLGNICRSPTAHGVFRAKAQAAGVTVAVESAGTGGWHIGDAPDPRALRAAALRGYDLSDLRAQQFTPQDFDRFDLILAMDGANLRTITARRPAGNTTPVTLFLDLLGQQNTDLPDPYYEGGFDQVLDLIERGSDALIAQIMQKGGVGYQPPPNI